MATFTDSGLLRDQKRFEERNKKFGVNTLETGVKKDSRGTTYTGEISGTPKNSQQYQRYSLNETSASRIGNDVKKPTPPPTAPQQPQQPKYYGGLSDEYIRGNRNQALEDLMAQEDPDTGMKKYSREQAQGLVNQAISGGSGDMTAGDIYGSSGVDGAYSDYEKILQEDIKPVDEGSIRKKVMDQFQAEVDALNKIYAQKLSEERVAGEGRQGQTSAIQARRGLIGSDFGAAQSEKMSQYNQGLIDTINAEKALKIQNILGQARKDAEQEIKDKQAARRQGAKDYIEYLKGSDERKSKRIEDAVINSLYAGVEVDDNYLRELASTLGSDFNTVKSKYNMAKSQKDQADAAAFKMPETQMVGNTLLQYDKATNTWKSVYTGEDKSKGLIEVSPGASLYDPKTGAFIGTAPERPSDSSEEPDVTKINGQEMVWDEDQEMFVPAPTSGATQKAPDFAIQAKEIIDGLLANQDLLDEVGFRLPGKSYIEKDYNDLVFEVDRLKALLSMDNLKYMKGLGAMSDREFQNLQSIATSLNVDMSEGAFKKELKRINENLQSTIDAYGQSQPFSERGDDVDNFLDGLDSENQTTTPRFNQESQTSSKGISSVAGIKDFSRVKTYMGKGTATGIEGGSKFWKYGMDFVLDGGKGAPVVTPFSGEVVSAKYDGGFGNSVKVKLDDGQIIRLSHLNSMNVKQGQRIDAGTVVGGQGNTGKTYGKTGIHVDITMYDQNGKPYTSKQVASLIGTRKLA